MCHSVDAHHEQGAHGPVRDMQGPRTADDGPLQLDRPVRDVDRGQIVGSDGGRPADGAQEEACGRARADVVIDDYGRPRCDLADGQVDAAATVPILRPPCSPDERRDRTVAVGPTDLRDDSSGTPDGMLAGIHAVHGAIQHGPEREQPDGPENQPDPKRDRPGSHRR